MTEKKSTDDKVKDVFAVIGAGVVIVTISSLLEKLFVKIVEKRLAK